MKVYLGRKIIGDAATEAEAVQVAATLGWQGTSVVEQEIQRVDYSEQLETYLEQAGHTVQRDGNELFISGWVVNADG